MLPFSMKISTSLFKHNLAIKLLCLVLSISVWGLTVVSKESRQELLLPVEVVNTPDGYMPVMQKQNMISFTIYGPALWIRTAAKNNRVITINMQGATAPGKTLFSNLDSYLTMHKGVRVIRTSPATLEIELSKKNINQSQGDQLK